MAKKMTFTKYSDLTVKEYNYLLENVLNTSDPYNSYSDYLKFEKHEPCVNNYFANKDHYQVLMACIDIMIKNI